MMNQSTLVNARSSAPDLLESNFQRTRMPEGFPEEDSVSRLIKLIKRRGWLILAAAAIGAGCGIAANMILPKQYTAKAEIEVTQDISSEFRLEQIPGVPAGAGVDSGRINTEMEVLRSRTLALETIRSLHLEQNADFMKLPGGHPWDLSKPAVRSTLIINFQRNLVVARLGSTDIIQINVSSRRPELASLIANTLVDNYVAHTFKDSYTSTKQVSAWLDTQLGGLKQQLQDSQQHLLDLQKEVGIVATDQNQKESIVVEKLEELNKQLADAEAERMVKEAALQAIQSSTPAVIDALSTTNPSIQASKQNLIQLQAEYSSLIQTYGSAYPRVRELKTQISQLESGLVAEEHAQVTRAQKELDAAQSNENMLRNALEQQEQSAYSSGSNVIQYELASREYESNRALYDGLQERLQEAGIIAGLHSTAVHVVDSADIPTFTSQPRVRVNVAAGLFAGVMFGFILALLLEAMDTNLNAISEIEEVLQLPVLGAIPKVDEGSLIPATFTEHALSGNKGAWSKIAEALRGLRTSILLSTPGSPPQVIMMASTRPAEGKTSISILESIIFALNGSRVLLMDADLRRPAVHTRLNLASTSGVADRENVGLSSVLSGKTTLDEAIREWPDYPGVHVLVAGPTPPLPSELLGSKHMEDLLAELRLRYDFIFIDTPPVMTVTDASVMSRLADATILVVRYGEARRHVIMRSIELLQRSGANLLGVVLNMVDFRSPEYSEYYGRKYHDYYAERE
jgi:capsular exopolysaccharide synthesis family protein